MVAIFAILLALILGLVLVGWIIGSLMGFILMLVIAGLIGAFASSVLSYRGGIVFSVGAGLIGAVVGTILANILGAPKLLTIQHLPLLWTVVGSFAAVAVAKVVAPNERRDSLGSGTRGLLR